MFTPPPSPLPPDIPLKITDDTPLSDPPHHTKRQIATRTKWSIVLVPLVLILITLTTRLTAYPLSFRTRFGSSDGNLLSGIHRRDISLSSAPSSSLVVSSTTTIPSATSSPSSSVPTVPLNPILPSQFPKALDTTLSQNFSSDSCSIFFSNMTASTSFQSCRPFSLLLQTSSAFLNAQSNLSLLNNITWYTCNTDPSYTQCNANMNWFADSLKSECATELSNGNVVIGQTLNGLLSYSLMRNVGCQSSSNVYCYISATANRNPSDYYFYKLPSGLPVPNGSTPSCSDCTKSMMAVYLSAIIGQDPNTTDPSIRSLLSQTYESSAQILDVACGGNFVQTTTTVVHSGMDLSIAPWSLWSNLVALVICIGILIL